MKAYLSYEVDHSNNTFNHKVWIGKEPESSDKSWSAYIDNLSELGVEAAIAENHEIATGVVITNVEFDCDGDSDLAKELELLAVGGKYVNICPDQVADMLSDDFGYCVISCSWEFAQ